MLLVEVHIEVLAKRAGVEAEPAQQPFCRCRKTAWPVHGLAAAVGNEPPSIHIELDLLGMAAEVVVVLQEEYLGIRSGSVLETPGCRQARQAAAENDQVRGVVCLFGRGLEPLAFARDPPRRRRRGFRACQSARAGSSPLRARQGEAAPWWPPARARAWCPAARLSPMPPTKSRRVMPVILRPPCPYRPGCSAAFSCSRKQPLQALADARPNQFANRNVATLGVTSRMEQIVNC